MADSWLEAVSQLEQATARVEALSPDDAAALIRAMNERSRAIARLRELLTQQPGPIPAPLLERLRAQLAANSRISRKLLLLQASARAELARITETAFLTRSLGGGARTRRLVDFLG